MGDGDAIDIGDRRRAAHSDLLEVLTTAAEQITAALVRSGAHVVDLDHGRDIAAAVASIAHVAHQVAVYVPNPQTQTIRALDASERAFLAAVAIALRGPSASARIDRVRTEMSCAAKRGAA